MQNNGKGSEPVQRKILRWAEANLFNIPEDEKSGELEINLGGSYHQDEAFLLIDGVDYYVFGKKFNGEIDIKIKTLKTLDDLPLLLPEQVPIDVYERLEKRTSPKKGWIRRSLP